MVGFAKFIDAHTIQTAEPRAFVSASGTTWYPPMPEAVLREAGYLPLVDVERPEPQEGFHAEPNYAIVDGIIYQNWTTFADVPQPIMISKAKVEAVVDAMGKTAAFVGWLQSSARYFGAWMRDGDSIAYDPQDNESDLASLISALGVAQEDVASLIAQVSENQQVEDDEVASCSFQDAREGE